MIFHGVIGQDLKEEKSPSFFNIEEVVIVRDYIKKLLDMKQNKISPKEIGVIAAEEKPDKTTRSYPDQLNLQTK